MIVVAAVENMSPTGALLGILFVVLVLVLLIWIYYKYGRK